MNQKIKFIISILILGLMPVSFCFSQNNDFEVPGNFEEVQQMGEQVLEIGKQDLPGIIKGLWDNNVLPVWQKMYDWFYANVWLKIKSFLGPRVEQEIETRKEIVEEEFEQEKKEVKKELPGVFGRIWKFIRDVIQKIKILWK